MLLRTDPLLSLLNSLPGSHREAVLEDEALKKPIFLLFLDLGLFPVFFFNFHI